MLSSEALDALAASCQPGFRVEEGVRRAGAREAVKAAAKELGLDPLAPSLPDFDGGEDVLRAATLRVIEVPGLQKTLEKHRARVAACVAEAGRLAKLRERRARILDVEEIRKRDQVMAGKPAAPPPVDAVAELAKVDQELAIAGSADPSTWVRADERPLILEALSPPAVHGSVVFYGALVVQRLRHLTADKHYKSAAARDAHRAQSEVLNLVKQFDGGRGHEDLARTARLVHTAVELADLHLLQEKHESTIAELDAASTVGRERPRAEGSVRRG